MVDWVERIQQQKQEEDKEKKELEAFRNRLRYWLYLARHNDWTYTDADETEVLSFDSGTSFDQSRQAIEYFNMADIWLIFTEIQGQRQMIFTKKTDDVTVRLMQALQTKKLIHQVAFSVYKPEDADPVATLRMHNVEVTSVLPRQFNVWLPSVSYTVDFVTIKTNSVIVSKGPTDAPPQTHWRS
jgi:type VI protein secretion system component Hcp